MNRRSRRLRTLLLLASRSSSWASALALDLTHALQRLEYTSVNERFNIRGHAEAARRRRRRGRRRQDVRGAGRAVAVPAQAPRAGDPQPHARRGEGRSPTTSSSPSPTRDQPRDDDKLDRGGPRRSRARSWPRPRSTPSGEDAHLRRRARAALQPGDPARTPTTPNDSDGRIRHMAFKIDGLETFPLAAARAQRGGHRRRRQGQQRLDRLQGRHARAVRDDQLLDVYTGKFPDYAVKGKIVVVGATAPSLQDLHATSTTGSGLMPGPEIQASAVVTALEGFPLEDAPGWVDVAADRRCSACWRRSPRCACGSSWRWPSASLALVAFARRRAARVQPSGIVLAVVYPVVAGLGALLVDRAVHGVTVAFEREQARDAFARFVPEAVVDEVLRSADGIRLGGVQREGTVMFSDLRGFTSFAETLEPATVIERPEPLPDRDERGDPRPRRHARRLHGRRHHGRVRRAAAPGRPRRPRARRRARHARPPRGLQRLAARGGPARGLQDGHRPQQRAR